MLLDTIIAIIQNFLFFTLQISSGSFPKPLTSSEERDCFEQMSTGNDSARSKIITHNLRLVVHVIKKYYTSPADQEDLISIGTIGLIKAVDSFNYKKGTKFATYAARCIQNEILMQFRCAKKTRNTIYISDPIEQTESGGALTIMDILSDDHDLAEEAELKQELEKVGIAVNKYLSAREKAIIDMRYGCNGRLPMTQQHVADTMGISRSYVSRLEKKALEKLRSEFEKTRR
ncbi:MAG: RNA polymerase sporulation sigma factor SigK [Oscillospiraceae bacterium]